LFERALTLDPRAPEAQIGLARVLVSRALHQMSSSFDDDIQRAEDLVAEALITAPNNPWAHHVKAQILHARLQYEFLNTRSGSIVISPTLTLILLGVSS
jgi:cytochrome c-type biogenesis protein CcmH/NrfG